VFFERWTARHRGMPHLVVATFDARMAESAGILGTQVSTL